MSASNSVSSSYAYTASSAISSSYAYSASSAVNSFSASKAVSSSYADTASFSNDFTVLGNLTVYGTQSVQYITSSQLNVSDNVITVNVASPGVRFGGLSVFDSGSLSSEATASLFWDSQNNHWIYQRESGSSYTGGMLISGPRNAAGLGNELGTTACMLLVGQGGDHLTSSLVYHDSTKTCFYGTSFFVSSSGNIGLGLNSPTNKLEVQSGNVKLNAGASRCTSLLFGITGTDYGKLEYSDMDGSMLITTMGAGSGYNLNLGTKCITRLTISGDGNVGINNCSPSNLLHLAGASATPSLRLGSISNGFHWDIGRENATTGDFIFNNANGGATTEKARITVGGNFGIGIACPATRLTVHVGSGAISGTNDAIRLQVPSYLNASRNTILWHQDSGDTILGRFGLEWSTSTSQMNFIWRDIYNNITGSTELMRLTGGGNLLVGATSNASGAPTFYVQNKAGAVANIAGWNFGGTTSSENGNNNLLSSGAYYNGSALIATQTTATNYQQYSGTHVWYTNSGLTAGSSFSNTERMRINSGGGVRIGSPTAFNDDITLNVYGTGVWAGANIGLQNGGTGGKDWVIFSTMCAFGQGAGNLLFYNNSGPTANGLIIYANGNYDFGGSDVSDARLKQDIENLNYGVNEIMQLSPKSYNLKSEDNLQEENQTVLRKRYGFIAQQVQSILPDTITGQETETDYLGLDYNGVLAVAVKAIQEQQCTINLLKTCIGIA
jgi:hypothetical protein